MNRNYNAVVHKNDTVYIFEDISQYLPMDRLNELASKLNGKKILTKRKYNKKYHLELFAEICDFKTVLLNGVYFASVQYLMLSLTKKNSWKQYRLSKFCKQHFNWGNSIPQLEKNCEEEIKWKIEVKSFFIIQTMV